MNKKSLIIEVVVALVGAVLVAFILLFVFSFIGGNFMTDFVFMGERGHEATGVLGIIFGLPIGGILGAYLVRRKFAMSEQNTSQAILLGLVVGVSLLAIFFVNKAQENYDSLRYYSGTTAIESMYPEFKNPDCFAGCSFRYDKDGDNYYFAYIVNGSGAPIVKATCFQVDGESVVTKVGEFTNPADSYNGYQDINPKDCSGIK